MIDINKIHIFNNTKECVNFVRKQKGNATYYIKFSHRKKYVYRVIPYLKSIEVHIAGYKYLNTKLPSINFISNINMCDSMIILHNLVECYHRKIIDIVKFHILLNKYIDNI